MRTRGPAQFDLFAPRPRRHDEALLLRRLREAVTPPRAQDMGRAAMRRLMTDLPRITVLD